MIDLREEKTRHILNHYGEAAQLIKALEELAELQAELWKVYKYIQSAAARHGCTKPKANGLLWLAKCVRQKSKVALPPKQ